MAKKIKDDANVTRISASDGKSSKQSKEKPANNTKTAAKIKTTKTKSATKITSDDKPSRNPLKAILGYFVGAWQELRQVHWPTRRATWSLTGAVLAFTAFFVVLILLLDALFKFIFELLLK